MRGPRRPFLDKKTNKTEGKEGLRHSRSSTLSGLHSRGASRAELAARRSPSGLAGRSARESAGTRVLANRGKPYNSGEAGIRGRRGDGGGAAQVIDRGDAMSQARCTFKVKGLDCPVEVDALNAALSGRPGVSALGFDLLHGTMTVDYDPAATGPDALIGRVAERAGMQRLAAGPARGRGPGAALACGSRPLGGDRRVGPGAAGGGAGSLMSAAHGGLRRRFTGSRSRRAGSSCSPRRFAVCARSGSTSTS